MTDCSNISPTSIVANTISYINIPYDALAGGTVDYQFTLSDLVTGGDDSICPTECTFLNIDTVGVKSPWVIDATDYDCKYTGPIFKVNYRGFETSSGHIDPE